MSTLLVLVIGFLFSYVSKERGTRSAVTLCSPVVKILASTVYNLFFHPLSHLPGPSLCRVSSLPSFYHAIKRDRHVWFWQLFQLYGGKVRASPNLVVFNSPDAYNSIFSHKANVRQGKFYDVWSRNTDDVNTLFTSDVQLHAKKRRLLNLAFTDHSVKAAGAFIAKHTDRWNELFLDSNSTKGDTWSSPTDVSISSMYLVFDVLMDLCFGAQMNTKEPGDNPMKKIPLAFDDFAIYNYPVSMPMRMF